MPGLSSSVASKVPKGLQWFLRKVGFRVLGHEKREFRMEEPEAANCPLESPGFEVLSS